MNNTEQAIEMLKSLKRNHHTSEDCWYSCPKCEEGCCDDRAGNECTCGADWTNNKIDEIIALLQANIPTDWATTLVCDDCKFDYAVEHEMCISCGKSNPLKTETP